MLPGHSRWCVIATGKIRLYRFEYLPGLNDPKYPAISLSLRPREKHFESQVLFPFFFGLLAEGENKALQCRVLGSTKTIISPDC